MRYYQHIMGGGILGSPLLCNPEMGVVLGCSLKYIFSGGEEEVAIFL